MTTDPMFIVFFYNTSWNISTGFYHPFYAHWARRWSGMSVINKARGPERDPQTL